MSGANVLVSGVQRKMGGLKESQAAFQKHHKEVGDALLNISGIGTVDGQMADKDDPRPTYIPQEFPKMIFHPEKGEEVVEDQRQLDALLGNGYRLEPYAKPQVALLDPKAEKAALESKLKQQEGLITSQNDLLSKLSARLEALEAKKK